MTTVRYVVFATSCLVAWLPAQNGLHESRGPLAGAPLALLVDNGLGVGNDGQTRVHRNGFGGAATAPLPLGIGASNLREILNLVGPLGGLDIDDISTGRDEVLITGDGFLTVPPTAWGVLSFSLRHAPTGGASGSRIAQEASLGSLGAAVFSWVLPYAAPLPGISLPPQVVARTERSHSRAELGLPAGAEVDALDLPLVLGLEQTGLAALEPGFGPLVQSPAQPTAIYFTVSNATQGLAPASWWGATLAEQNMNRSGATVLCVTRQSPSAPWGVPQVYCTWLELGLTQNEDIDGLAVDALAQKVMFSVVGTTRDQFLYSDVGTDGGVPGHSVVKTPQGTPISSTTQVGTIQNDDVDAICTLDPKLGTNGMPPPGGDDFGSSCGSPRAGLLGVPSVHASAFRRRTGGQTFFDTWMVGWPPNTGITAGFAVPCVTLGNDLTLIQLGPVQFRNVNDPTPGNPLAEDLPVPLVGFSLTGTKVTFRWFAFDANLTELAEAWPVVVFL